MDQLDLANRRLSLTLGGGEPAIPYSTETITADNIVVALGSSTNFHDIPGVEQHSYTIISPLRACFDRRTEEVP